MYSSVVEVHFLPKYQSSLETKVINFTDLDGNDLSDKADNSIYFPENFEEEKKNEKENETQWLPMIRKGNCLQGTPCFKCLLQIKTRKSPTKIFSKVTKVCVL